MEGISSILHSGLRQTFGPTTNEKQYLNTVIPYEKKGSPPSVEDLQMLTNSEYPFKLLVWVSITCFGDTKAHSALLQRLQFGLSLQHNQFGGFFASLQHGQFEVLLPPTLHHHCNKPTWWGKSLVCITAAQLVGSQHLPQFILPIPGWFGGKTPILHWHRLANGDGIPFWSCLCGCSQACCINCMGKLHGSCGAGLGGKGAFGGQQGPAHSFVLPTVLFAMKEGNEKVPTLLTDYILKVLCPT
uniref:Uncharacterized protein n=1 Tax=Zonotrichia albicollis TaxID=44394 RepID=A0A8D2NDT7_ZONAL